MKIETFTVSIACHKLVTREELAAALRTAANGQNIYYVEAENWNGSTIIAEQRHGPTPDLKKFDKPSGAKEMLCRTPDCWVLVDNARMPPSAPPRKQGAKRRGRPPKAATADPKPPIEPAPKPKRRCTRGLKTDEERGVPVTHRTCADGTKVETRGRCPGGATP